MWSARARSGGQTIRTKWHRRGWVPILLSGGFRREHARSPLVGTGSAVADVVEGDRSRWPGCPSSVCVFLFNTIVVNWHFVLQLYSGAQKKKKN